jgi:hypothetical protein
MQLLTNFLIYLPGLIAEVILYSEGFESSKNLAQKMTQMYKLCSEQLSQQDHYDFGMRAVKSVLVMAGSLKRQNPDKNEDVVLIRALRDSNLPKFLQQDAVLFQVGEGDVLAKYHKTHIELIRFPTTSFKIALCLKSSTNRPGPVNLGTETKLWGTEADHRATTQFSASTDLRS